MDLKERLEIELNNMKAEAERCSDLAYKNFLATNFRMYHVWDSRANAFKDCIAIIEECIKETNKN